MTRARDTLRVGVIGTGAMGTSHIRTIAASISAARVTAVYDFDVAKGKDVAEEVGAEALSSAQDVIDSADVDAVVIASPDPTHEELTLGCLAAGKPVLCEKPLGIDARGSRRIVDAEVAVGRRLIQVGFMRRFDPGFVELRAAVAAGAVGRARLAHCVHRNASAHPTTTSEGIVANSMIHELDTVPWVLDDPLAAITVLAPRRPATELRDPQIAILETQSGLLVTVEVFVNAGYGYDVGCEVVGDRGTLSLTPPYGLAKRRDAVDGRLVSADFVARFADAYRIELAAWVRGVFDGAPSGPSAWDGHCANLAAAAGIASLRSGTRMSIEQPVMPALYR